MNKVYFSKDMKKIIKNADFSHLGGVIGIKVHFGEKGCVTYLNPKHAQLIYEDVISNGKKAALVECNVLYRGSRTHSTDHIKTAKEHGFGFAPIDILDGEKGHDYTEVHIKHGMANPVRIGKHIKKYDSLVVLTHFKGHGFAGFGGAIKNVGMGLGSRAGKLHMHANIKPTINTKKCIGCSICIEHCDVKAITLKDKKAVIEHNKCIGCAMCIGVCPQHAAEVPWGQGGEDLQKKIVDYTEGVLSLFPKGKIIYINVLEKITPMCDCFGTAQKPIMDDVGILLSDDIVAIDKASFDLVMKHSHGKFDKINAIDKSVQVDYAEEKGLGKKEYELVSLD